MTARLLDAAGEDNGHMAGTYVTYVFGARPSV